MTRHGAAALMLCALVGPASAQTAVKLVPAQSEIVFTSKQMGVPVEGRFKTFEAQVALDPKQPEAGRVSLNIAIGSATLGLAETDAELLKASWFDAAKFPQASFRSTALKRLGSGRFEVAGTLAIKGATQAMVVPVAIVQSGGVSVATGGFRIKRLDFKLGEAEWADTSVVANEVAVRFKFTFSGLAPL